jgi:lipoprotein-releasing system permease protein
MPFELIVALRYLREGKGQTLLSLTGIGVIGVIIFLSALIGGLQNSLVARTLGTQAHVVVRPREEMPRVLPVGDDVIRDARIERPPQRVRSIVQWQRAQADIERLPRVVATAPTIAGAAIAVRGAGASSVVVRGVEPASYRRIVPLDSFLVDGRVDLDGFKTVIGTSSRGSWVGLGDRLSCASGRPRARRDGVHRERHL